MVDEKGLWVWLFLPAAAGHCGGQSQRYHEPAPQVIISGPSERSRQDVKEEKQSFLMLLEDDTKDHPRHMPHSTVYKMEEWTTEPVEVAGRLVPFNLHM